MEIVKMEITTPITRRVITYKGKKDIAKAIKEVNGLRFAVFTFANGTTKKDRVENYKSQATKE